MNRQIKKESERLEKRKITDIWEYWKHTPKQTEMKEKKKVSLTNEKAARNKAVLQKSHPRDKRLGSPTCKILRTILKMHKGRIQTNAQEDNKIIDDVHGLIPEK